MDTAVSQDVINMFAAANESYSAAEAVTGQGSEGEWPPEGIHECVVTGVEIETGRFKIGDAKEATVPCVVVRFTYQLLPDESSPFYDANRANYGMSSPNWKGKEFQMVFGAAASSLPQSYSIKYKNGDTREVKPGEVNIKNISRFKGHLSKLLGISAEELNPNPLGDIQILLARINSATSVTARVEVNAYTPPGGNRTYHTDYIKELISA